MSNETKTRPHAFAVVEIESTDPYSHGAAPGRSHVVVNPVRSPVGFTFLVEPEESEEATEPFLETSLTRITDTELRRMRLYTTTEEDPHIRWPIPISLLMG